MNGVIVNYKGGKHTQVGNQMIISSPEVTSKEQAQKLVGKKVTWNTGKKDIVGEVRAAHGNSGALRVLFETGMPGQAVGTKVTIEGGKTATVKETVKEEAPKAAAPAKKEAEKAE